MPYCEYNGCKTESSFNFKGMPRKYCSKHKEEGMLNVKDCICIFENCNKQAYYNYIGFKEKLYCKNHKLENMVDVKNKLCKYEACQKQPAPDKLVCVCEGSSLGLAQTMVGTQGGRGEFRISCPPKRCVFL